jgi:hypothetical protein
MSIVHFHVPGEATRREYAVYVIVISSRVAQPSRYYIGKTGDNRDGHNPVISRFGNHLSYNAIHSQTRTAVGNPESHDFDVFSISFDPYRSTKVSRDGVDLINEMERQLNGMAQEAFGKEAVMNPLKGTRWLSKAEKTKRAGLATAARLEKLRALIVAVKAFVVKSSAEPIA